MTDTPTAGLEKRLRDAIAPILPLAETQNATGLLPTIGRAALLAADALAKARVALEGFVPHGVCMHCYLFSSDPTPRPHKPNCPIVAALEALK